MEEVKGTDENYIVEERPFPGVLLLVLNRPRKKNAISGAMYLHIARLLDAAAHDDSVTCVVLTGRGDYFSSGADLTDESWAPDPSRPMNKGPAAVFMRSVAGFPKLLVAALNGPAVGVAVTLLSHVDMAYAVPGATLWTPFFRMAIVPEFASSTLFPEIMGRSKACEMLFLGKRVTAEEAQAANLISEVIPKDRLMEEVLSRLRDMLSKPLAHKSVQVFKAIMRSQRGRPVDDVITAEFEVFDQRIRDGDLAEAVAQIIRSRL